VPSDVGGFKAWAGRYTFRVGSIFIDLIISPSFETE